MSACNKCGCSPCGCGPSVLNNPQIISGVFDGPTINGPTINGGQANNLNLVGAQIDCTSRACTAGVGICNDGVATNAQVCNAIAAAISGSNPAFCAAVSDCLSANPTDLCPAVASCIATTPSIINTTAAFGFNSRATTALFGVVRYATIGEVNAGNCLLALDPCTLISALSAPNVSSPFWLAFTSAVCAAGASCFAPLNSPAFTGIPTAPTAAAGTNTTQIATTAFVTTAINNAISSTNPAFCGAVAACLSGGAPTCASVSALFPAAGGNPPAGTRFLGSDCLSYTAAQIVATGGGGGGGSSGGGCGGAITTFTGPWGVTGGVVWLGADNSCGAGFVQVVGFGTNCASGFAPTTVNTCVTNGVAAQIRAGACQAVFGIGCQQFVVPSSGDSGVQS